MATDRERRARPPVVALIVGPDPGHALPVLGIGAELVRRGVEVTVWTGERHRELAATHGIAWHHLPRLAPEPGDEDLGHRLWGRAAPMARDLVAAVAASGPDLLVVDTLTTAGALVAGLLGRPHVEVVPHHLPDPDLELPPVGLGRAPARGPLRRWDDRRIGRFQARSHAVGRAQADAAARAVGLDGWPAPRLRLLQTLPSLERVRSAWPTDALPVGSLALDPDLPPLAPPEGDEPLVVVSDSTATGVAASLADTAIVGLRHAGVRVVITSAGAAPGRRRWLVVGLGPHRPLFARADLVVSAGGGGTVAKAAAAGVPHLVVPGGGDQREAAARLRDAHAGTALTGRLTPRRLRFAVVRALTDGRLRDGARALAAEAARLGPPVAAERCLALLGGDTAPPSGAAA